MQLALVAGVVSVTVGCSVGYTELDRTTGGLVCRGGGHESSDWDYGDVPEGFPTVEEAADYWWSVDDATLRADRDELTESSVGNGQVVVYSDDRGRPQVAVLLSPVESGWIIVGHEACIRR